MYANHRSIRTIQLFPSNYLWNTLYGNAVVVNLFTISKAVITLSSEKNLCLCAFLMNESKNAGIRLKINQLCIERKNIIAENYF